MTTSTAEILGKQAVGIFPAALAQVDGDDGAGAHGEDSTAMENMKLVKGTARLTALMAYSPTPLATNRPSTMEYRENTIREATVAAEKWRELGEQTALVQHFG